MKTFKRITALFMCLLMFASVCVVSNAVDESVPEAESEAVVEETTVRMGLLSRLFKRNNTSQPVTEAETQ
nr:hypothetical protein [Clostridiales bacterium]